MKTIFILSFFFISNCAFTQELLTIGEIFDFSVGDVFQYKSQRSNEPDNADRLTILGKSYSENNDTVYYTILRNYYDRYHEDGSFTFIHDTIHQTYTNLNASIFYYTPELAYDSVINKYFDGISKDEIYYDTIVENSSDYCGTLINGLSFGWSWFSSYRYLYGKGLGFIEESIWFEENPNGPEVNRFLFYFKKADSVCGIPDLTNVTAKASKTDVVKVFPNPASDYFNVKILSNEIDLCNIVLYDLTGKKVIEKINSDQLKFDISNLTSGIYLLKIDYGYETKSIKLLVR